VGVPSQTPHPSSSANLREPSSESVCCMFKRLCLGHHAGVQLVVGVLASAVMTGQVRFRVSHNRTRSS